MIITAHGALPPAMASGVTITVFAGISGIDKAGLVSEIVRHSRRRGEICSIDFEARLLNRPPLDCPDMPSFLDIHHRRQKLDSIVDTFRRITRDIEAGESSRHIFLSMHLSYFKNGEFFPPLMPHLFSPMLDKLAGARMNIITLIDDAFTIRQRLHDRAKDMHQGTALRLREIMIWRSQEALCAEGLQIHMSNMTVAGREPIRSYLVSVRHPHSTFESLIFGENPRRAYLSYPISSTRALPDAVKEINDFRSNAHRLGGETATAVFDPVTIDEMALRPALARSSDGGDVILQSADRWPLGPVRPVADDPPWPMRIPASEVCEVLPRGGRRDGAEGRAAGDVENQIRSRDYRLVEDAHFLAAYRPVFNLKKSEGVDAEIRHAKEFGRKVVVYHPPQDAGEGKSAYDPFGSNVVAKSDPGEFLAYLRRMLASGDRGAR